MCGFFLGYGRLVRIGGSFNQVEEETFGMEGGRGERGQFSLDVPVNLLIRRDRLTVEKLWIDFLAEEIVLCRGTTCADEDTGPAWIVLVTPAAIGEGWRWNLTTVGAADN